jgi:hypothetical protein
MAEIDDCVTLVQFNKFKQSLEEKQDRLARDFEALLTELRGRPPPNDVASNHGGDAEDGDGRARGWRNEGSVHGRGRGRNRRNVGNEGSDDEYEDKHFHFRFDRRRPRGGNREDRFGKLEFTMPKFDGGSDLEAYFTWELKVDKIFRLHNYTEQKKLAMTSLEFDGYALIWWEQLCDRDEDEEDPISTSEEMK